VHARPLKPEYSFVKVLAPKQYLKLSDLEFNISVHANKPRASPQPSPKEREPKI
jgi:hypothetical protein